MTQERYDKLNWLSRILFPKLTLLFGAIASAFSVYGMVQIGIYFSIASAVSAAFDAFFSALVSKESMKFFKEVVIQQVEDPVPETTEDEVVG